MVNTLHYIFWEITDPILICHNVAFEKKFITEWCNLLGIELPNIQWVDSMYWCEAIDKWIHPITKKTFSKTKKLEALWSTYKSDMNLTMEQINNIISHRADSDVLQQYLLTIHFLKTDQNIKKKILKYLEHKKFKSSKTCCNCKTGNNLFLFLECIEKIDIIFENRLLLFGDMEIADLKKVVATFEVPGLEKRREKESEGNKDFGTKDTGCQIDETGIKRRERGKRGRRGRRGRGKK